MCIMCNLVYRGNYQKNQLKELKAVNSKESKIRRGLLLFVKQRCPTLPATQRRQKRDTIPPCLLCFGYISESMESCFKLKSG